MKIMITGGTNGMGKGVAKILAGLDDHTHEIIILCRSKSLGEATVQELAHVTSNHTISIVLCDLTKLSDVKKAIQEILQNHSFLDALFINAGLGYAPNRIETEDGMDQHFQVNYLSQFMLTLNLLPLLERSQHGGRVIFNATHYGSIGWDDLQMKKKWSFEKAIFQAMAAKRMFAVKLHSIYKNSTNVKLSFVNFEISQTVWTNQIAIIPSFMRAMATIVKWFGGFISIYRCGEIMAPLFTEKQEESLKRSGKLITWKKGRFVELTENDTVVNQESINRLWDISLELCKDEKTREFASKINHR